MLMAMKTRITLVGFAAGLTFGLASPALAATIYGHGARAVQYLLDTYVIIYMNAESVRTACFF
jgi:hypothetical protein